MGRAILENRIVLSNPVRYCGKHVGSYSHWFAGKRRLWIKIAAAIKKVSVGLKIENNSV